MLSTFFVDSPDDSVDVAPGDGVAADSSGRTSLRAAIMEANALPGFDSIVLPAGTYQFGLYGRGEDAAFSGDLDIFDALEIIGDGSELTVIDGSSIDRIFEVFPGGELDLMSLSLTSGSAEMGGGLLNRAGQVTLTNVTVNGNDAVRGGGIANVAATNDSMATISITDSSITGNSAEGHGGGILNLATADSASAVVTLSNSLIESNSAEGSGGGVYSAADADAANAIVSLSSSVIDANSSEGDGGGIASTASGSGATSSVLMVDGAVTTNSAEGNGGGIASIATSLGSTVEVTLTGTLIVSNSSEAAGGGVYSFEDSGSAFPSMDNVALEQNSGVSDSNVFGVASEAELVANVNAVDVEIQIFTPTLQSANGSDESQNDATIQLVTTAVRKPWILFFDSNRIDDYITNWIAEPSDSIFEVSPAEYSGKEFGDVDKFIEATTFETRSKRPQIKSKEGIQNAVIQREAQPDSLDSVQQTGTLTITPATQKTEGEKPDDCGDLQEQATTPTSELPPQPAFEDIDRIMSKWPDSEWWQDGKVEAESQLESVNA